MKRSIASASSRAGLGRALLAASALLTLGPTPSWCQEGASLSDVEALMAQGRIMEARGTLEAWWTARFSTAAGSDRQRGIWLRGKLTVDPSMAELDFRRLVLEFPGGPYTDDALFRLGLSADLRGELTEARGHFERLVRDHPSSPRVREAREWIEAHSRELEALPDEPARLEVSGARRPIPMAEPRESGEFAVQLGAFRSLERALSLAQEVQDAGYSPRVVRTPGSDLARVRVGRFPSREAATELAGLLEELGFEVTLATDAGSEERVGTGRGPGRGPEP